jgi:hypothetical protein
MLGYGLIQPVGRIYEAICQHSDVEAQVGRPVVDLLFFGSKQVNQEGSKPRLLEHLGHVAVSAAMATAATAMREQYDSFGPIWYSQVPIQKDVACGDAYQLFGLFGGNHEEYRTLSGFSGRACLQLSVM